MMSQQQRCIPSSRLPDTEESDNQMGIISQSNITPPNSRPLGTHHPSHRGFQSLVKISELPQYRNYLPFHPPACRPVAKGRPSQGYTITTPCRCCRWKSRSYSGQPYIYLWTVDSSGIFCKELAVLGSLTDHFKMNILRKRPVLKLI